MKSTRFLILIMAATLVAAACGSDDTPVASDGGADFGLVTDGTLSVCTDVPYPPMEYEDSDAESGYTGFDIELIRAIATDLGLGLEIATPGFDAITSGLAMEAGNCDISVASITITPEREEGVDFSSPYFEAEQSLLVEVDSGYSSSADVGTIAVQSGTTGELFAQDSLPDVGTISFEAPGDLYLALAAGDVGGVMTDVVGNQGYADENPGAFSVIETFATDEQYGMAVQEEGSEALLEAVNASLKKLEDNGEYDTIYGEWFAG